MKRAAATERIEELLGRVLGGGFYVDHVKTIYVFGSYARGAVEVRDIDLAVEYEESEELLVRAIENFYAHRNWRVDFMKELRGSRRGFEITFNAAETLAAKEGFALLPIYERGDSLDQSLARLYAIKADVDAGAAPRDAVLPEIEGLEKLITLPERLLLHALIQRGGLVAERVTLEERLPKNKWTHSWVENAWAATNPKRRAAFAAAAWLEEQGAGALWAGLPGRPPLLDKDQRSRCAYFGLSSVKQAVDALSNDIRLCLCVYNETRRAAPLLALALTSPLPGRELRDLVREAERNDTP